MYNHNSDSRPGDHISPLICQLMALRMHHVSQWPSMSLQNGKYVDLTQFSTDGLERRRDRENRPGRRVVFGKKGRDSHFEEMMKGNFSQ